MCKLTVVMYHYVRDFDNTEYKNIKGLDVKKFIEQLDYLESRTRIIGVDDLIEMKKTGKTFKENISILTFDDGYKEHYEVVYPILKERNIKGAFFPVIKPVVENTLLDVNKVHYVLSEVENINQLLEDLKNLFGQSKERYGLDSWDEYYKKYAKESRFDSKEVIFIKRMLQRGLPEELRTSISSELFEKYVGVSEEKFSKRLYMNEEELKEMSKNGMHIGIHSYSHKWLDSLDAIEQEIEIDRNIEFLNKIGVNKNYSICYPYGAYNDATLKILEKKGISFGFTTEVRELKINEIINTRVMPRIDTNDLTNRL